MTSLLRSVVFVRFVFVTLLFLVAFGRIAWNRRSNRFLFVGWAITLIFFAAASVFVVLIWKAS
jgi:hypothetical protein